MKRLKRKAKTMVATAIGIILATIAIVIGVFTVVINNIVESKTIDTISELAAHDKNTIEMFLEYNWKNLERIGFRLQRSTDGLNSDEAINEYLGNESDESTFDKVFFLLKDGTYYSDYAYHTPETISNDYYDFTTMIKEGVNKNVILAELPAVSEDKVVVYSWQLTDRLAGITVGQEQKEVLAVIGAVNRATLKAGLVIDSFTDSAGNPRGSSSVVNLRGEYVVKRENAEASSNWFQYIEECESSDMTAEEVKANIDERKTFWFYYYNEGSHEVNYCVPLEGASNWYFLLTVDDAALKEQSNPLVLLVVAALGVTVLVMILAMVIVMLAMNKTAKARAQEKAQGEFLANMSHEIRTPLNGIVGLNYLMMTSIDDSTKTTQVKEWLTKSHSTAKYLLSLINDVLDISKLRSGKADIVFEPMSIEAIIDAIHSMQCENIRNRGIEYKTDIEIGENWILGDEVHIKQVLMNIVSNAAKFTPAGGYIKLTVRQNKTDDTHVTTSFVCEDTGCGMSKEFMAKIFDAFTQDRSSIHNSTKGTGLGMAISKMLVKAMNGDITVESEPGKGSVFTVTITSEISAIPDYIEKNMGEEVERMADELASGTKPLKILVAEDNELNAEILIDILESAGFTTAYAENGKRAVEIFEASEADEFDLILMDMRMPVMDGCEASRTIRGLDRADAKTVLIFACTANTFNEDRIKAYESGMTDFLTKPIDVKVLLEKLERLGNRSGNEQP